MLEAAWASLGWACLQILNNTLCCMPLPEMLRSHTAPLEWPAHNLDLCSWRSLNRLFLCAVWPWQAFGPFPSEGQHLEQHPTLDQRANILSSTPPYDNCCSS